MQRKIVIIGGLFLQRGGAVELIDLNSMVWLI
jgi:hypothetical protein